MTESELAEVESWLGFSVPANYRSTLTNYPFPSDSYAEEFMLPNDPRSVIELNDLGVEVRSIEQPFFIGSDGGEDHYFVDAADADSPVYVFELETGKHRELVGSWTDYLQHIRGIHDEIAADEESERERKRTKRWWEFWK